jgi:tRNA-modifying protein YgfZ
VLVLRGDDAEAHARATNLTARPGTVRPAGDGFVVGREDGVDVVGPSVLLDELRAALIDAGARDGNQRDLDAWRIAAGIPSWGREVTAPHLPEEVGLLPTHVHLGKGCYPGQEAIARMWMLGRPRRRLALVEASGGSLTVGWQTGSGRKAVTVTSVDPADGRRALAFVPGDAGPGAIFGDGSGGGDEGDGADDGGTDVDGGIHVEVVRLIGDDPAPPGHDPAVVQRRHKPRS